MLLKLTFQNPSESSSIATSLLINLKFSCCSSPMCLHSLYNAFILFQIKTKCRSKRNGIAANIRNAMFATFGDEKLERVDSSISSIKLAEWKMSEKTRVAYNEIFNNYELLTRIGFNVFKQYKEKELSTIHCAYILSICDILLNPKSSGIKCNDKSVV